MPRTLKNNDSLLNFFVGREVFSPVWSEGQVVQMGPGDQASQGGPGGQVVRWSGGQMVKWSGGQVVRWSGGQVVRWSGGQVIRWSGGQVVRVVRVVRLATLDGL